MENDKLVRMSDAISAILEDKITGQQLEIMRALASGPQAETLNQACDRHAQYIRDLPAVDAVEVCRCRDCVSWEPSIYGGEHMDCTYVIGARVIRNPDDFCSRGQRREDGDV